MLMGDSQALYAGWCPKRGAPLLLAAAAAVRPAAAARACRRPPLAAAAAAGRSVNLQLDNDWPVVF